MLILGLFPMRGHLWGGILRILSKCDSVPQQDIARTTRILEVAGRASRPLKCMQPSFARNRSRTLIYGTLISLFVGAAVLGLIIAFMEQGDFPGWGPMLLAVLATVVPANVINAFLPSNLFIIGAVVGAVIGGFAISALCGMSVKRASIAAGIFLAIQVGMSFALMGLNS